VICTEDLIRFFEEQRRLLAGHWKMECQQKDEHIRSLNMKLAEYSIDYKLMKQTEASLSHELQCLQDRHSELRVENEHRREHREKLRECLAEAQQAEASEAEAAAAADAKAQAVQPSRLYELEAQGAGLRVQLQLLEEWRRSREAEAHKSDLSWAHSCIWRDELDVRESQLEKITSQLDYTNNALQKAQAALASQRERHDEVKQRHRDAETQLREDERTRVRWRRECVELRRAEAELRRMAELQFGSTATTSKPSELASAQLPIAARESAPKASAAGDQDDMIAARPRLGSAPLPSNVQSSTSQTHLAALGPETLGAKWSPEVSVHGEGELLLASSLERRKTWPEAVGDDSRSSG